jgi:uncharacterized membrane protein YdjX (TVP38/TMEM64 family)
MGERYYAQYSVLSGETTMIALFLFGVLIGFVLVYLGILIGSIDK